MWIFSARLLFIYLFFWACPVSVWNTRILWQLKQFIFFSMKHIYIIKMVYHIKCCSLLLARERHIPRFSISLISSALHVLPTERDNLTSPTHEQHVAPHFSAYSQKIRVFHDRCPHTVCPPPPSLKIIELPTKPQGAPNKGRGKL